MFQKIFLVGNLGRDPEMRYTPQGTPVTTFSMATSRRYNTADGQPKEETVWFRVSVFGKSGEACNQYLSKGSRVLVEGRLTADETGAPRIWTGQDGKPRASFEVFAESVKFLSSKREGGAPAATTEASVPEPNGGEDLPF